MTSKTVHGLAILLAIACGPAGAAAGSPTGDTPPAATARARDDALLEPFLRPLRYGSMTLSPNGRHIAAVGLDATGGAAVLTIFDADTLAPHELVLERRWTSGQAHPRIGNPRTAYWVSDTRLAVDFGQDGAAIVGIDGAPAPDLMQGYVQTLRDDAGKLTPWQLVLRDSARCDMARVNAEDGTIAPYDLRFAPCTAEGTRPVGWASDASGNIRVLRTIDSAVVTDDSHIITWYRRAVGAPWTKVDVRSVLDEPFVPRVVPSRPGHLVVQARNGQDALAIWDYDVDAHAFAARLAAVADEDITDVRIAHDGLGFNAVETHGLKRTFTWLDPQYARLQAWLDTHLPDHVNAIEPNTSGQVLVNSSSDRDPGRWYLLDTETMSLKLVGRAHPAIDPARMQPTRMLRFASFDGLSIPAYLTLPGQPSGPAPLVVLVRGNPQTRDQWTFDAEVQLLAAHGYAVFAPQLRGSAGFGKRFEQAGHGQWDKDMQRDIAARVRTLVDQKIADPQRLCIVGAGYGGYAALRALEKDPLLFKCGVARSAVLDPQRLLDDDRAAPRNIASARRPGGAEVTTGSVESVSPLRDVERIVAPLLLVHGRQDGRVPISQGLQIRNAMTRADKDVEWIQFADDTGTPFRPRNVRTYYAAVFRLLERTIGKGMVPAPPPAP